MNVSCDEQAPILNSELTKTIGERLQTARKTLDVSQSQIAEALGISQTTIYHIETGRNETPSKYLSDIARMLQISFRWLRYGEGDMLDSREIALDRSKGKLEAVLEGVPRYDVDPTVMLPEVELKASLGPGNELTSTESIVQRWPIDKNLLTRENLDPEQVVLMRGVGESMRPTICDGDLVIVNKAITGIPADGVYAIETSTGIRFKRIRVRLDNSVEISSDNENKQRFPTEVYPADVVDDLIKIHGMVVLKYLGRVV